MTPKVDIPPATVVTPVQPIPAGKSGIKKILLQFAPFFGLLSVFILFVILCPPEFYSFYNIKTIITQTVIVGIAAMGMTIIIISGGIELSDG